MIVSYVYLLVLLLQEDIQKSLLLHNIRLLRRFYVLGSGNQISDTSCIPLTLSKQLTVNFTILSKSRPVLQKVIDKLHLDYSAEQLLGMVAVENPSGSSILKVTVTNPDAQLAADISNAMSDAIAQRISEVMLTDKPSTVEEAVKPSLSIQSVRM